MCLVKDRKGLKTSSCVVFCNTMVSIDEVKRDKRKKIVMSIRTTEEISEFMKDHEISPSLVFHKAMEKLMDEVKCEGERDG